MLAVSSPPCNGPRAPSPRSTPVHTNYKTARTQIEALFCTCCFETTERSDKTNTTSSFCADHKMNTEWQKNTPSLHTFIPLRSDSTVYVVVLDCSDQQCTNGAWCPRPTAAVEQKSKQPTTY